MDMEKCFGQMEKLTKGNGLMEYNREMECTAIRKEYGEKGFGKKEN